MIKWRLFDGNFTGAGQYTFKFEGEHPIRITLNVDSEGCFELERGGIPSGLNGVARIADGRRNRFRPNTLNFQAEV